MKNILLAAMFVLASSGLIPRAVATPAAGAPGDLDITYSGDGRTADFYGIAFATVVQPDGKIVAAGSGYGNIDLDFAVARYNTDGTLDTSFGGTGVVTTGIFYYGWDEARAVAIQPDGKIVAVGTASDCYYECSLISFAIVRYNPDGTLDTSFGGDGIVATLIASSDDRAYGIAIQPDGKILVSGRSGAHGQTDFTLVRYNRDGTLDATFDSDGIVRTAIRGDDFAGAIALQTDGKIVTAGQSFDGPWDPNADPDFAVARYNANGSLDTTFDSDGKLTTAMGPGFEGILSVAVQPDGKIVAAGFSSNGSNGDFALARYNVNGSIDTTFDFDGKVTTQIGSHDEIARAVVIQADGKIVVTGNYSNGSDADFAIARYNADGSLDTAFGGGDGKVTADFNGANDNSYGIALDREGRAVVVGHSDDLFVVARFIAGPATSSGTPFDYDGDGKTDISIWRPSDGLWWIIQSGSQNMRVHGWGIPGDKPVPADYDGDGKTDLAVFRPSEGNWYILNSEASTVSVAGWGVPGDLLVPADYGGDGKADLAVWRPAEGNWYRRDSDGQVNIYQWGIPGDKPAPADFNGDGVADMTVFRPSEGNWYTINSGDAAITTGTWGGPGDVPVPGDYSGDGKADFAVFRPSDKTWYRRHSQDNTIHIITWGIDGDMPAPGDYDGDGKQDLAIWRPSDGNWWVFGSTAGIYSQPFGITGDIPTPNAFVY